MVQPNSPTHIPSLPTDPALEPQSKPQVAPNPTPSTKPLPDPLRAFRKWILKMSSTGDLTVHAADSLLQTLNMFWEKDSVRYGPEFELNPGELFRHATAFKSN